MTNYKFNAFRQGSTNGQASFASVVVTGCPDKASGAAFAAAYLSAYKVLGSVVKGDPVAVAARDVEFRNRPCPVVEFAK